MRKRNCSNHENKIKWKNIIIFSLTITFIILIIISSIHIVNWYLEKINIDKEMKNINNLVTINEIKDTEKTEIIKQENTNKDNPYWSYIKMNLIDVNFDELKAINNEVIGWIQVNGTNINYPFVQTKNNSYYLTHSFDKSYNTAGWVFADYRNNFNTNNKNTILYAHGRLDKTMFGSLKNILKSDWLKNSDNYIVKISTEDENTLWQVFSVYRIPTTNDYLQISFNSNQDFNNFTKMLKERSNYDFNTNISKSDKILTLSTCYNNSDKVVLHAKLIKRQIKK